MIFGFHPSFLDFTRQMGEYLFDIACHIAGYEDGEDAVEYVYEQFHSQ